MDVFGLILPVFAVIVAGWVAGAVDYLPRATSDALIHFAYNVAMPALLIVTIAEEPARSLVAWRFLLAFGGGTLIAFAVVFLAARTLLKRGLAAATMLASAASMTNTGFVALPILQATYGPRAVLPAAIATVFLAVVMLPLAVVLLDLGSNAANRAPLSPLGLMRHVGLNPMVLSTAIGVVWAATGLPMPTPAGAFLRILADSLTASALFAIGLGLSIEGLRLNLTRSAALAVVKLVAMPIVVFALADALDLSPLYVIAAVVCAAVPTAKTVYILAGEYHCEEPLVAATVSLATLASVATLMAWIVVLAKMVPLG
jgi:predicted permease